MKIEQQLWSFQKGWRKVFTDEQMQVPQLVLAFGNRTVLTDARHYEELREFYPAAQIVMCSTAGEILQSRVTENTIVATAIYFEKTQIRLVQTAINDRFTSFNAGRVLAEQLQSSELQHVLVFSDGQLINGSELVSGLNYNNQLRVPVTGGLAGDGANFIRTLVGANTPPMDGSVVAVGFYGKHLKVGYGSKGGWTAFGPERRVTSSVNNVLHELDQQNALQLYKRYLGPLSHDLPVAALLFPLCIEVPGSNEVLVRTVLNIDEENQTMIFAGDIPEGSTVRLMKASVEKLIDAAGEAANNSLIALNNFDADLALLISCIGRRLVLSHRAEEEVEEAIKFFGSRTRVAGFYSYGEISPLVNATACELHNQTMTITTFKEE